MTHPALHGLHDQPHDGTPAGVALIPTIIAAWQAGRLSEGQAAKFLRCDRIQLREWREQLCEMAEAWVKLTREGGEA